jgi:hypothetical protein
MISDTALFSDFCSCVVTWRGCRFVFAFVFVDEIDHYGQDEDSEQDDTDYRSGIGFGYVSGVVGLEGEQ